MSEQTRIIAGPFNRVEGDLEIRLDIEDGAVVDAYANSPLFRGFEQMLSGKDPRDAMTITPRICGICSISQSAAAARAIAAAQGLTPTEAGAKTAALIHGTENVADHLTHFHLFFMPDFAKPVYENEPWHGTLVERFSAMEGSAARAAVAARTELMHLMGLLAGKWPHTLAIQPGGVTKAPDARDRVRLISILRTFRTYLEKTMFGDSLETFSALKSTCELEDWRKRGSGGDVRLFLDVADAVGLNDMGRGPNQFMSYGAYETADGYLFKRGMMLDGRERDIAFDRIDEDTAYAWMTGDAAHPFEGRTTPDLDMSEPAYSWCKAPRLDGRPVEVGALARQIVDGHPLARELGQGGASALGRVIGRLLEIARTVPALEAWATGIEPGVAYLRRGEPLLDGQGAGLVEAARGSLGHWLVAKDGRIANYQIIAPTTWNFSPRDAGGVPGPVEQALRGAVVRQGETTPISVQHIVRSFDPCMVCTVH